MSADSAEGIIVVDTSLQSERRGGGEGGKGGGRVEGGGVGVERWRLVPRQVERNLSVHFLSPTSAHCT